MAITQTAKDDEYVFVFWFPRINNQNLYNLMSHTHNVSKCLTDPDSSLKLFEKGKESSKMRLNTHKLCLISWDASFQNCLCHRVSTRLSSPSNAAQKFGFNLKEFGGHKKHNLAFPKNKHLFSETLNTQMQVILVCS